MKSKHPFFIVFILAVLVRATLNFSVPLVPGLGGGYNLVQIRAVLESGRLALPDMPLLFYFNALIVKAYMVLFQGSDAESMIIIVSKLIDTFGFPLLLCPLYLIQQNIVRRIKFHFLIPAGLVHVPGAQKEKSSIFQKPMPPENTELVYESEYFEMYALNAE